MLTQPPKEAKNGLNTRIHSLESYKPCDSNKYPLTIIQL